MAETFSLRLRTHEAGQGMTTLPKDRPNVVSFEARRSERTSVEAERQQLEERAAELERLRLELEQERAAVARLRAQLDEDRRSLEHRQADFEEELGVLEEQRHFLDAQRDKLRRDAAAIEGERESMGRSQAVTAQRRRVESAIEEARLSRETERIRIQAEMAGLLRQAR
jgi:chromosome segregation ATPase